MEMEFIPAAVAQVASEEASKMSSPAYRYETPRIHETATMTTIQATLLLPVRISRARHPQQQGSSSSSSSSSSGGGGGTSASGGGISTTVVPLGPTYEQTPDIRSRTNRSEPNDYVDEPTMSRLQEGNPSGGQKASSSPSTDDATPLSTNNSPASESKTTTFSQVVTSEPPKSDGLKKRSSLLESAYDDGPCRESIFCPRCRRCRCTKCSESQRLPTMRCGASSQCAPEDIVLCCSCLSCVKAVYDRRCTNTFEDGPDSAELLCACDATTGCLRRWSLLALLLPCLPCLCLYWPLHWALSACTACYNCRRSGCRCRTSAGSSRLLLVSEEPESSSSSSV